MMLAVKAGTATARLFVARQSHQTLRSPLASLQYSLFSSSSDGDYVAGTVKFYMRNKAYGFVIPDKPALVGGSKDVWVQRTSFDTPHSPEEFPIRPYLYKNERVKFRFEPAPEGGSPKATDLVFENGRQIPLFRKNYAAAAIKGECSRLGESVLEIMTDEKFANLSDAELMVKIKEAAQIAKETIGIAQSKQDMYGPSTEH